MGYGHSVSRTYGAMSSKLPQPTMRMSVGGEMDLRTSGFIEEERLRRYS